MKSDINNRTNNLKSKDISNRFSLERNRKID